jgi:hypothetical protein
MNREEFFKEALMAWSYAPWQNFKSGSIWNYWTEENWEIILIKNSDSACVAEQLEAISRGLA